MGEQDFRHVITALRELQNAVERIDPTELADLIKSLRQLDTTQRQRQQIKDSYQRLQRLQKVTNARHQIRC